VILRVARGAEEELAAAAAWYEERRAGLGVELVAEIDAIARVVRNAAKRYGANRIARGVRYEYG
jgi:hypothetical protein